MSRYNEVCKRIDELCSIGDFSDELLLLMDERDQLEMEGIVGSYPSSQEDIEVSVDEVIRGLVNSNQLKASKNRDDSVSIRGLKGVLNREGIDSVYAKQLLKELLKQVEDQYRPYIAPINLTSSDIINNDDWLEVAEFRVSMEPIVFKVDSNISGEMQQRFIRECKEFGLRFVVQ